MKTVVRFQLTFSPKTAEKLQKLAADKGLSKSALVAVAVDKLWKEERPDEEKKDGFPLLAEHGKPSK